MIGGPAYIDSRGIFHGKEFEATVGQATALGSEPLGFVSAIPELLVVPTGY